MDLIKIFCRTYRCVLIRTTFTCLVFIFKVSSNLLLPGCHLIFKKELHCCIPCSKDFGYKRILSIYCHYVLPHGDRLQKSTTSQRTFSFLKKFIAIKALCIGLSVVNKWKGEERSDRLWTRSTHANQYLYKITFLNLLSHYL